MISDQAKEGVGVGEAKKVTVHSGAIHFEIDGTMKLSHYPIPRKPDADLCPVGGGTVTAATSPAEAGLRHIIRLQHQALSQQSIRIQQQRTLIFRLNMLVNKLKQHALSLEGKSSPARFRWLESLLRPQAPGQSQPSD